MRGQGSILRGDWMRLARRLAGALAVLLPLPGLADRGALTLEVGGDLAITRLTPSVGSGDAVEGTLGGAEIRIRYALTNRYELEASGFWNASATFVNSNVHAMSGGGPVTGALRREVGRGGAAVGARYVAAGSIWRVPLGIDVGWLRTSSSNQDLIDLSNPQNPVSFGLNIEPTRTDRFFVAPFAGLEWVATDHFSVSVVPRLELPIGSGSSAAIVFPFTLGFSWYLL